MVAGACFLPVGSGSDAARLPRRLRLGRVDGAGVEVLRLLEVVRALGAALLQAEGGRVRDRRRLRRAPMGLGDGLVLLGGVGLGGGDGGGDVIPTASRFYLRL